MTARTRLVKRIAGGLVGAAALVALATPAMAWQDGWSYRTKITLTPSQAGASGAIGTQPVLVRLHSGNFDFANAKPDGSDIRFFAGDDKTPLKFEIEKWDARAEIGLVWVQAPDLSSSGATPVYLYYGNSKATPAGGAQGVFGNQALAWHFAGDGAAQDSSGHGVIGSATGARDPDGVIGNALRLDGQTGVGLPTSFTLAAPATVSLWVKPAAANAGGSLFAVPGGFTLGLDGGVPFVSAGAGRANAAAPVAADGWTHLAVVADGGATTLYVNGQPSGQIAGALPASAGQAAVGQGFAGDIDEVEVTRAALPAGAIALAAQSQGSGAKLASFDKPEEVDAGGHGYFGILLGALTPDAWVVIILLGIMSLLSWAVMISKGIMLGRVSRANDAFLDVYEKQATLRADHDGLPDFDPGPNAAYSSLGTLYRLAQRELKKRLAEGRSRHSRYAIRAQSVAAIRSALDAGQVRQGQQLNRWMVLLTIAISGGPFLGLLGTVIGVMITFAAVAAAGDVNINAIAPGIAAALLATVAGLVVAIPALFGYNYLLSRIEEIDADDQIFVDEVEKRIAETWQHSGQDNEAPPPAIAAE